MQCCGIRSFVGVFGVLSLISWSMYTVAISQISSIEKAFGLSSTESGWILTIWELGYVLTTVVASYFTPKIHIPRAIGAATVVCGLGGIVFVLPHFVAYTDVSTGFIGDEGQGSNLTLATISDYDNLCRASIQTVAGNGSDMAENTTVSSSDHVQSSSKDLAYALFCISMILQGAGKAPCYPYSAQYVDDNVEPQMTGFYLSISSTIGIFGLAVGFGLGSIANNIHVSLKETSLSMSDPRYIGAWWLAFLAASFASVAIAIPMFMFPKRLKTIRKEPKTEHDNNVTRTTRERSLKELKRVFSTLGSIAKSPIYVLVLLATCFQICSLATFVGFEPKYMETQFSIPAWEANIILGVVSIMSFGIGNLLGGYITKRWDMTPRTSLAVIAIFYIGVIVCLLINAFLGCRHQTINDPMLDAGFACDCEGMEFLPICSKEGNNYFSPCAAGCTHYDGHTYSNCSLIEGDTGVPGLCDTGCDMFIPYAIVKFIMNFVDAGAAIPTFLVFLRAAGENRKALAVGMSAAVISIGAWVPGPIIGGRLIDSSCLIWNTASTLGSYCSYYNIEHQRHMLHGVMIGLRMCGMVFLTLALIKSRKMLSWPKDEDKTEESVVENNVYQMMKNPVVDQ